MDPKSYLHDQLQDTEQIIWEGRPLKKAMRLQAIFGMLPIVIIWLSFATIFISGTFIGGASLMMLVFIIPFFAVWLTPVWIWIGGIFMVGAKYNRTYYIITNRRILLMNGSAFGREFENLYYQNVGDLHLNMAFIDNMCGTGTINLNVKGHEGEHHTISHIENSEEIFKNMQKCIFDIASDVYFPNDKRPLENHGYNTEYRS